MGNAAGKLTPSCLCPAGAGEISRRHDIAVVINNHHHPFNDNDDDGLGHSFCYIRPDQFGPISKPLQTAPFFRTISGASISANTSTPLSTSLLLLDPDPAHMGRAASFESSPSFASVPLQPIPRNSMVKSGPLPARNSGSGSMLGSGPIERGFLSGPIERGFVSGPIDHRTLSLDEKNKYKTKLSKWGSIKGIKHTIMGAISKWGRGKGYDSIKEWEKNNKNSNESSVGKSSSIINFSRSLSMENDDLCCSSMEVQNLQWAQGKAGEDRVQIVVSEDHGWVFVGIYDGFNGPDAPDFLLSNLYPAVHKELKGLLQMWNDKSESELESISASNQSTISKDSTQLDEDVSNVLRRESGMDSSCSWCIDQSIIDSSNLRKRQGRNRNGSKGVSWDSSILELDERVREKINQMASNGLGKLKHPEVHKALSEALRKTEEAYLDVADRMVKENPELALMGSCVLVMLMMGEDIYLMNVGDSRAVLGQKPIESYFYDDLPDVSSLQLTLDHNTYIKEEVDRIRSEHPDDPFAMMNDRVKGSLKVTRAFGAGFLKQPKWNDALLEMFRIDYVGSSPYITCCPSLSHHKIGPRDKFMILSSDGLYQYFTNQEVVSEVELFMSSSPEGDPAQHLIEEVLFRASKKAGLDFHELLEIPQGERRRYHDDVSVIVISLEGRIWRSSV